MDFGQERATISKKEYPETNTLRFNLNGELVEIENPDPEQLLVHWLRGSGHTGTKFSCGQGGCGACTVNIRPWLSGSEYPIYNAVNGCLRPLLAVHEMDVLTVEGLGSYGSKQLHPVQERIAEYNGSQCGWCTPGFVMGMNAYLENTPKEQRTLVDIENIFDGHLCRCTGFRSILCGMKTFSLCGNKKELEHTPPCVTDPSMTYSTGELQHPYVVVEKPDDVEEYDIPDMLVARKGDASWHGLSTIDQLWTVLQKYEDQRERVRLIVGNTAYGIQPVQPRIMTQNIMIYIGHIPVLKELTHDDKVIVARCAVTIERLRSCMKDLTKAYKPKDRQSSYPPLVAYEHWKRLATTEIRNVASIAGNLYLARYCNFPSDLLVVLATLGATVVIRGHNDDGNEYSMIDFVSKEGLLRGTNIIYEVRIPIAEREHVFIRTYKVAKRPQNSHPLVNGGFSMKVDCDGNKFENPCIVFGNISERIERMPITEKFIADQCAPALLAQQLPDILKKLDEELVKTEESKASSKEFRRETARNLLFKYLVEMAQVFELPGWNDMSKLKSVPGSVISHRMNSTSSGRQDFCVFPNEFPVSEPIIKQTAFLQATGEAKYTQDIGREDNHLNGVYILSLGKNALPYAKFMLTIPSEFRQLFPDVVRVFTAEDLRDPDGQLTADGVYPRNDLGSGQWGYHGDTLFAQDKVLYIGQPVGMVVAKSEMGARKAAVWLQNNAIVYHGYSSVDTLAEAIEQQHFLYDKSTIPDCAPEEVKKSAHSRLLKISRPYTLGKINWESYEDDPEVVVVNGTQSTGSQYHFYMETQSAIAYPTEGGGIKVYASTQSPASTQGTVARVCQLPLNQVSIEILRIGGGYGGKEVQSKFVPSAAAFCAQQLQKPVRVANDRVEDMQMIGKRHAYYGEYKVAATKDGIIKAMEIKFYNDAGCTYDATFPVMDLTLLSADNAYYTPEYLVRGECAMTNTATNTAFRSFGVVQTMLIVEAAMEAVVDQLGVPDDQFRQQNFYKLDQHTPYGQQLHYCNLEGVWELIKERSNYDARKQAVQEFNVANRYKKRGIKLIPLKYGISFTYKPSNQGTAVLNVYSGDGTVLLAHGGVEMGQGLNTKMMQIAACKLNIPMDFIRVAFNSTEQIANAVSTGASTGSDLNGGAVSNASTKLRERFEHFLDHQLAQAEKDGDTLSGCLKQWKDSRSWFKPGKGGYNCWKEVVGMAYTARVSLISSGHYKSPGLVEISEDSPLGHPFYYFNYGASVSEVEVDTLTGEFTILRADIVYDAGKSLNPAIDVGQIEGGFVMGVGYVTSEKLLFDKGRLETDGTWEYKPPCSKSIPEDLRVTIYPGANHHKHSHPHDRICHVTSTTKNPVKIDPSGIQSSKSTGEPPLVLANSVFFAIKQAVAEARKEAGLSGPFTFDAPATVENIQQSCCAKLLS